MNFDHIGYELNFIQRNPSNDDSDHLFTLVYKFFSPVTHYFYIVHADYHCGDVFAVKFYCKKDRKSEFKYSKIVNKGDIGNILITCAKVVPLLLRDYPTASFGFMGARSIDISTKKVEDYTNNQRFRIYKRLVALKFGTETFAHFEYEKISSYLLINKNCESIENKEKEIVKVFIDTYQVLPDIS